ncbi:MAG: NupC/NupG family nucleoside CNT transporter [Streptococcaceae bacterium]|nr:NupC/NupG family nucleoside CNT transporter [Streptococcaceae bacterium]
MSVAINIIGIFVFIGIAYLFSEDRKSIKWRPIVIVIALQLALAAFFIYSTIGRDAVMAAANGFTWLIKIANDGIAFALPDWLDNGVKGFAPNFVTSALLPILLIVPLFDILTYIGVLPFIIKWIGWGLSKITGQPRFESFFSVEMMFLGNTEVLAISKPQLNQMSSKRNFTLALMSMSCITASIIGAYAGMVPGEYVITAIPLNILGAIAISSILNPVEITEEEDIVAAGGMEENEEGKTVREPFFSFLGDSIIGAGKLIFIITITVIAFVALASLVNHIFALTGLHWLTLENILGVIMFPFAWLLGFTNPSDAFHISQLMGTKLVTNEFVVMLQIKDQILNSSGFWANRHATVAVTVFLTSFANFSTVGMIIGAFKGLVGKDKVEYISKRVPKMLLAGILVSLLSAAAAGLFAW